MARSSANELVVVVGAVRLVEPEPGRLLLPKRFLDGMQMYAKLWPGPVTLMIDKTSDADTDMDCIEVDTDRLRFDIEPLPRERREFRRRLERARLVLAGLGPRYFWLARLCREIRTPLVFISVYSVRTRRQIVRATTVNVLRRWRRYLWTTRVEQRLVRALRLASGIQCNGTPTYECYRSISPRPLLFFDNRIREDMVAPEAVIQRRTDELRTGRPIRLAFSGRLIAIKGVDHLPVVAAELKRLGTPFEMHIFGGGDLEGAVVQKARALGVSEQIQHHGVLDFQAELVPFMRRSIDLFVCCHRQGDPSFTYIETMASGTPIVGYCNEAFLGIAQHSGVGWTVPMDRPDLLARRIADLSQDPQALVDSAFASACFARKHTFEKTFRRRVEHMESCCQAVRCADESTSRASD